MRFMIIVPANAESEAGKLPDEKILAAMGKFNEEMVKAGVMLAGEGLHPTSKGARLRFAVGLTAGQAVKVSVTDGPFTESKELIAGFWMIQVKSKQEAIEWMKRAPFGTGVVLEIRQVFEVDDLAPSDPTGEVRAREERLRTEIAAKTKL
ncbi:MAG: YciI family protein [Ignavibacteria bacterium]|nr:YciI family protein [Ignavibacteria bacterium]MBI3766726.1 YciI family protein [Ignavibacteriales bacterium]